MSTNYSYYGIPALYLISYFPHGYAIAICKRANNNKWDNSNPRSSNWDNRLKSSVSSATFSRYERAEAAHKNGLESIPLFLAAIFIGNLADLDVGYLNSFAALYCVSRLVYNHLYITIESTKWSYARTAVWITGFASCFTTLVKAANKFAK